MFEPGERVVVGVSGGPDSVALLHVLSELNIRLCLKIGVAHLDHNLRSSSAKDMLFVKKQAEEMRLPFYAGRIDWKKEKAFGSIEERLRNRRYDFFFKVCRKFKVKKIVLGHTRDDQAETVLMRILRGSGLYGLSAILPSRTIGPIEVVRPLIEVTKKEVFGFLKENNVPYRLDETNSDERFMRNKIRHGLLPLLERDYNPNIKEVLSSLALLIGADYAYLRSQARDFLKKGVRYSKEACRVDLEALKKLDVSLQRFVLRSALESLQGDLHKLTFRHWQEMEDLIFSRPAGSQVHLPGRMVILKTRNILLLKKV